MDKVINGVVVKGYRVAGGGADDCPFTGGSIANQIPKFLEKGIDVGHCFPATINVDLEKFVLDGIKPKFTTTLDWYEGYSESFSICDVVIEHKSVEYAGYLYLPHPETKFWHQHRRTIVELLAPKVENLNYGDTIAIRYDGSALSFSRKEKVSDEIHAHQNSGKWK